MEMNELFNINCQKFIEKYDIFKDHKNPVINGLCNLIYLHTYIHLPKEIQNKMKNPNINDINIQALNIYKKDFPKCEFELIMKLIN